jgi:hypothetical protein
MSDCWKNRDPAEYYKYRVKRKQMMAENVLNNSGKCTLAIPDVCTGTATQAHHTLGVCAGLLGPIVPACGPCNTRLGDVTKGKDPVGGPLPW